MTNQHPITPTHDLVYNWRLIAGKTVSDAHDDDFQDYVHLIAVQAARWGADQALEAVVGLLGDKLSEADVRALYASLRPKVQADNPDGLPALSDVTDQAATPNELIWALKTLLDGVGDSDIEEMTGLSPEKCKKISEIRWKALQSEQWGFV